MAFDRKNRTFSPLRKKIDQPQEKSDPRNILDPRENVLNHEKKIFDQREKKFDPRDKSFNPQERIDLRDTNPQKQVTHETYEGTILVRFSRLIISENFKTHYVFWIIIDKYTYLVLRNFHAGA